MPPTIRPLTLALVIVIHIDAPRATSCHIGSGAAAQPGGGEDGSVQTYFQSAPGVLGHLSDFGGNDLLAGQSCGAFDVTPESWGFDPTAGHTYEVHINGATSDAVTCAETATSCVEQTETFEGSVSGGVIIRNVDIT